MARQAAGNDEERIYSNVVAVALISRREPFGGGRYTAQPPFVERKVGRVAGGALLDLDKSQRPTAAGDEIDLSTRHAGAAR